jgi:hypothetical protein
MKIISLKFMFNPQLKPANDLVHPVLIIFWTQPTNSALLLQSRDRLAQADLAPPNAWIHHYTITPPTLNLRTFSLNPFFTKN